MVKAMMGTDEVTENALLGGRVRYRQFATGHRSGFEPVLLAAAVPAKPGALVLELGLGAGAGLLCLAARVPGIVGIGVEISPKLAYLAAENFKINGLETFFSVCGDAAALPLGRIFDHILANPPWHDAAGTASPDAKRALAHRAGPGLLASWIAGMANVVKAGGSLSLIIPAASLAEAVATFTERGFSAVTVFPLWARAGQAAKQVILQAKRKGSGRILPGLVLHNDAGITPAANAVLRDGVGIAL